MASPLDDEPHAEGPSFSDTVGPSSRPPLPGPSASFSPTTTITTVSTSSQPSSPPFKKNSLSLTKTSYPSSPLATRFSSGDHVASVSKNGHPDSANKNTKGPEQRFSRAYSGDSPTIYDFPGCSSAATASFPSPIHTSTSATFFTASTTLSSIETSNLSSTSDNDSRDNYHHAVANHNSPLQSPTSVYDQYQDDDGTDFEDLISPAVASREDEDSFEEGNIPVGRLAVLQTDVPGILTQYGHYEAADDEQPTPIDPSPSDDRPAQLIVAEESRSNINSNMSLSSRKASPPPRLILAPPPQGNYQPEPKTLYTETAPSTTTPTTTPTATTITETAPTRSLHHHHDSTTTAASTPVPLASPLDINKPLPIDPPAVAEQERPSPGSAQLATFFTWASTGSPSTTDFSDKGYSPLPSPYSPRPTILTDDSPVSPCIPEPTTTATKTTERSTTQDTHFDYCDDYLQTPTPPISTSASAEIDEMEDDLRAISAQLAASVKRELDLEDLVEELQLGVPGKRTSDYFSDSGLSTAKFSEYDQNREETERTEKTKLTRTQLQAIEKVQRQAEQDQAKLRLDLTAKLQDERDKRRELDDQIRELSQKASQVDRQLSPDTDGRLKELESTCDDLRRRLSEERESKNNFQDLLSVLKGELQSATSERDNLRDEVVPQLRAQVEGLEAQAGDNEQLTYESTKMQQELVSLKEQNTSLKHAQVEGREADDQKTRELTNETTKMLQELHSLKAENTTLKHARQQVEKENHLSRTSARGSIGKLRSNSVTVAPASPLSLALPPAMSLSRSLSVKSPAGESREGLSERLKDVEAQRDALHNALKNLLERQEFQNRENEKKIKVLEVERDRLLTSSPRKASYEKEVSNLRAEINILRRRGEEAIEQKWQVEKGLGGLKMDLDRAEGEIASLTALLNEKDIMIPDTLVRSGCDSATLSPSVTSASLERAYKDLQTRYSEALVRIRQLELGAPNASGMDEKTALALERLEQSLEAVFCDRDMARSETEAYKTQVEALYDGEKLHLAAEAELSSQLSAAATRMEELAAQVTTQLAANSDLRKRLAETVARGEAAQKSDSGRITQMQARLRQLEEKLVSAQTAAEERVTRHEEEISVLREGLSKQDLSRPSSSSNLRLAAASPLGPSFALRSPRSPLMPPKSPRLQQLSPARRSSFTSQSLLNGLVRGGDKADYDDSPAQVEELKARVEELEKALSDAETEMQDIVGRMSLAQMGRFELEEQKEALLSDMAKLQKQMEMEQVKAFEERFKNMATTVAA